MSDKESIIINLDNIDTNTKETEELRWRLQEEAYIKIKELFKEYNGKIPEAPQDISECRTRNTALIVGGRGSGKTYFLLNISKYLKDNVKEELNKRPFADNFHFFAPIDPTLLHKNENFLTVILAKILNELEKRKCDEKLSDEDKKKFYEKLAQVAEAIDGFDGERKNAFQIISSDQSGLRLEQYIHEFFGLVSKTLGNKQLVLLIDDVDMAFEKGYEVLETVRKYLASPYVISVVTGDMCLYERIIHKEFADNLSLKQKELDGYMEDGAERICREGKKEFVVRLADDYLGKLFEYKSRAKLKSLKDLSKCDSENRKIWLKCEGTSILLCDYIKTLERAVSVAITQKMFGEFNLRKFLSFAKETFWKISECFKDEAQLEKFEDKLIEHTKMYDFVTWYVYFQVGEEYLTKGQNEKAIKAYQKSILLNPKYDMAYFAIGKTYANQSMYQEAIVAFQNAIRLNEKLNMAYSSAIVAYVENKGYEQAIDVYKKAMKFGLELDYMAYYYLITAFMENRKYNEAIHMCNMVIELKPTLSNAYFNLLYAHLLSINYKIDERTILRYRNFITDERRLKEYDMLHILEFYTLDSRYLTAIQEWQSNFSRITSNFDFTLLDEWMEAIYEPQKRVNAASALATFKQHFNNQ